MIPVLDTLPILILNPHNRCNCRCVMCDIWKTDTAQEISAEDLERHVADMERLRVEWVVFTGGEPLMHSDFFRLCRLLRQRNIRITVLSTGLLLKRYSQEIVEHVDDLIVSLDGPPEIHDRIRRVKGAFAALANGVQTILQLRPDFSVSVRSTVQKLNCVLLRETAAAARALGAKSISFLAADVTSTAFNRPDGWLLPRQDEVTVTAKELPLLEAEVEALISEGQCGGFVLESPVKLHRIVQHFRAHLGLDAPSAPRCNAPWVSAVVETDGLVRPCFFHPPIGRISEHQSLFDVINGPEAVHFRTNLDVAANSTCQRCVCSLYRAE
ncbi:MAG TPA: radical SAM protein [Bryobacteraceae bacterium]|jgi:MoaA/NifB/PqqE/SkfB family radical SAM enzyme